MVLFSWIYLRKYLLPCLFFQAFAPSVLFLLDFPVVAWSRSSSDSVHKVWNKSDGEDSNSEVNLLVRAKASDPGAESTRLILPVPGQIRRYSNNASKLHVSNRKNLFKGYDDEDVYDNLHKQANKEQSNFV